MPPHTVRPRIRPGLAAAGALVLLAHALLLGAWAPAPGRQPRGDGGRPPAVQTVAHVVHTVRMPVAAPVLAPAQAGTARAGRAAASTRRDAEARDARDARRPGAAAPPTATATATAAATSRANANANANADADADADAGANADTGAATGAGTGPGAGAGGVAGAGASAGASAGTSAGTSAHAGADAVDATAAWSAAPQPGGQPVPTYATQLPPSTTLQFALRRGAATGRAELVWQLEADGSYQLQMRGQVAAAPPLVWRSEGTRDAHGIAPQRYGEWRRGRELRAANFQRGGGGGGAGAGVGAGPGGVGADTDAGRITFSGPQLQHPLLPGAQDRISWMLQLPAVLAANPGLQAPGSTVQLFVAGARGDADVWTFTVRGTDVVTLADGSSVAGALHLQRQPDRPYDTRADIWLDPARGHLPVRALLTVLPGGDATEFVLDRQPAP